MKNEEIPRQVQEDSTEYIEDGNPYLAFIIDNYASANHEDDRIQYSTLFRHFKSKDYTTVNKYKIQNTKYKEFFLVIIGVQ